MNRIFDSKPGYGIIHISILLLRIGCASMMLTHGIPKLMHLISGEEIKFGDPIGLGTNLSFILATFAEAICSLFILVGLVTRLSSIPLIINMSVITFVVWAHDPFSRKELSLFYLISFILLFLTGGGKYSFDGLIERKTHLRKVKFPAA